MSNNSWIDLPVVEAIEYFGGVLAQAYKWMHGTALIFGVIGIVWCGFKVMMSRMTIKDFWWDTLFKWVGFILLMELYPSMTVAFSAIGHEIGMDAGGGKQVIISGLTNLRNTIRQDLATQRAWAQGLESELNSKFDGLALTAEFDNSSSYADYMNKVDDEIGAFRFDSRSDKKAAQKLVEEYRSKAKYRIMFGARTLSALERVIVEKELDGSEGDDLTNTYVDLDIFLRDAEGRETDYISPSALLKVSLLSCQIMFEKENVVFNRATEDIEKDGDLGMFDKMTAKIAHQFSRIPQMLMCFFSCVVLLLATIFATIQYVMTILEYTIIVGIAAIFIPLMLFDGTKDIPKKFIPVFTSFLVKTAVMTICIMFVYYLMIENCINTIADDGGMNWSAVGEIAFESILAYILTQNAPKVAQTILTGQPQLSMGEAVAGAGTALATVGAMRRAPGAALSGVAKAEGMAASGFGAAMKGNAAAKSAKDALGTSATGLQKIKAGMVARGAVAGKDLVDRMKAKYENARKMPGTGIPVVDKAFQMAGLQNPTTAGGGGSGGASAHGIDGQGTDGKAYSAVSNPSFSTATKYDSKTGSQRSMTHKEFNTEKMRQGVEIGSEVGRKYAKKLDAHNKKKVEKDSGRSGALEDNLSGGERTFEK